MKPGKIKVGLVQTTVGDDKAKHVQKTLERVREAAARGAKLICLQELFASPYFCQVEDAALFDLAEPIPGPTSVAVSACGGRISQQPDRGGTGRRVVGHVSQDAHSRRPAVLREVLFYAW